MNSLFSDLNPGSYAHKNDQDDVTAGEAAGSGTGPASPDVFRYEDYRAYLRDRFLELQSLDPAFSQRGLARKAGIANPGFFNEVIKGRRRLSPAAAVKMAFGLDLGQDESEYFSTLVEYAETREPRSKHAAGKRMIALRNRKFFTSLESAPEPSEGLREIVRELDKEWVLKAAGLDVKPEGNADPSSAPLQSVDEGTLRSILDRLVDIREQSAEKDKREDAPPKPVVQVNLRMQPRTGFPKTGG
ncbi:MAG: hypothetical protein JWP91_2156 [Fibrobacteres bacterium]|nr:hypothetical protein [Fibrobacterota bacterium]